MGNKLRTLLGTNFKTSLAENLGISGVNRIFISFTISKEGTVANIDIRAPHPILENEARRLVQLIPQLKPGIKDGIPVCIKYSLPLVFKIVGE